MHISFREHFTHDGNKPFFNPLKWIGFEWLINKFSRFYEKFFCWILPAGEIYYELEIVKKSKTIEKS